MNKSAQNVIEALLRKPDQFTYLLERYDMFLRENAVKLGRIKADASSNKTQNAIIQTFRRLTSYGLSTRRLSRIEEPVFVDSAGVYGIQIADAFAYCILKHRKNHMIFPSIGRSSTASFEKAVLERLGDMAIRSIQDKRQECAAENPPIHIP